MRSIIIVPLAFAAIVLIVASVMLYRRRLLSVRYFVGWVFVGATLGTGSLTLTVVREQVDSEVVSAVVGTVALVILFGLLVQLSISVSGLQRQLRQVSQAVAILDTKDLDTKDLHTKQLAAKGLHPKGLHAKELDTKDLDTKDLHTKQLAAKGLQPKGLHAKGLDRKDLDRKDLEHDLPKPPI